MTSGSPKRFSPPAEEEIGLMTLKPWATISGRLIQAGRPVQISPFYFGRWHSGLTEGRFQDSF